MKTAKELKDIFTEEDFIRKYSYSGKDLGAVCSSQGTVFKLWSPLAQQVQLHLYRHGTDTPSYESFPLKVGKSGVWEVSFLENLHGVYYDYDIYVNNQINRSADPYARACGLNGSRSMAVELCKTNPEGWELDTAPGQTEEQIIYELHVKEFSWEEAAGFPAECRGKYKAFTKTDTTLYEDGIHPTGLPYVKELGVTHVQLMPVYDYGSVEEGSEAAEQFNWGYDPVNFNVPEGSYATDAANGEVRIRELKELVMSLHQQGFRVIMDVVYNHTYHEDSWFQRVMPWYYYRQEEDGSMSDGSGCGNDVASEREMCGKYIRDSVLYWAEEYHIDGFRFDLMGLLNVELINGIQQEFDTLYGSGEKLLLGEPWAAGHSPMEGGFFPALKENLDKLHENVSIFCDNTRDAIKGHIFEEKEPGFVNGGSGMEMEILRGAGAWCDKGGVLQAKAPSQIITYISSHDNLTLWDKLVSTICPEKGYHGRSESVIKAYKLAAAMYLTCQGRLFMLSGEEFARTKEGIADSFASPIAINRLDWERAYENLDIISYYKDLIALRKQLPGLYDKSRRAAERIEYKTVVREGVVSFRIDNGGGDPESDWTELFIAYNGRQEKMVLELPDMPFGKAASPEKNQLRGEAAGMLWEILADGQSGGLWKCPVTIKGSIVIEPISAVVLGRRR